MNGITTIILAAGKATRMRPLSLNKSKSLIPLMSKPLLYYLLQDLTACNFNDFIINIEKSDETESLVSNFTQCDIKYHYDNIWNGTAGKIKDIINNEKYEISNPFMVIYGDSLLKADYSDMLLFHIKNNSSFSMLYHNPNFQSFLYEKDNTSTDIVNKRTNFGVLDIDKDKQIIKFVEKPKIGEINSDFSNPFANAAVYILEKKIVNLIPPNIFFDFANDLFPIIIKEKIPFLGYNINNGYRIDNGTIRNYYNTHFAILNNWIDFNIPFPVYKKSIWLGENTDIISVDNIIGPVLIADNCKISKDVNIDSSVIGSNFYAGKGSSIINSIILDNVYIGEHVNISHSIIGNNCFIDNDLNIKPNSVLGDYCSLGRTEYVMSKSDFMGLIRD